MSKHRVFNWVGHKFYGGAYLSEEYKRFHRDLNSYLRAQGKKRGLELITCKAGHYDSVGFFYNSNTKKYAYWSISDVRFWKDEWCKKVLVRTAEHDKDWMGGQNNFSKLEDVAIMAKALTK